MKIIYISPYLPTNMKSGGYIRNTVIFNYLCRFHEVYLAIVSYIDPIEYCIRSGQLLPIQDIFVFTSKNGFINTTHPIGSLNSLVKKVNPDLLWAYEKWVMRRVSFPKSIPTILDLVDVPWPKLWRTLQYKKGVEKLILGLKTLRYIHEDNIFAARARRVIITNAQEKKYLLVKKNVLHIPNGFTFPKEFKFNDTEQKKLIFIGLLGYFPNLNGIEWFCKNVWPLIYSQSPQVTIEIIGDISSLAGGLDHLRNIPGVNLHGFVEDIDPWISQSSALVVPLLIGGGTRLKIIEAWAKGLPVVSTSIGCEGLGAQDGETLLIADRPREFADACLSLLNDPEKGQNMARKAYDWSKNIYDWEVVLARIPSLLENL